MIIISLLLGLSELLIADLIPSKIAEPKNNVSTPQKIELGKKLYFDPRLSLTGTVSCNSCHNVMSGGVDGLETGVGIHAQKGGRNSPTVWNSALMSVQFWDGRAQSLEEQAKGPLTNPIEMGMPDHEEVMKRVRMIPGYVAEFKKVFNGGDEVVTIDHLAKAIAAFERTLVTRNSAYDRFLRGDKNSLNPSQKKGLKLFREVGCISCHSGPNFAGPILPEGTGFFMKFPTFAGSFFDKKYELTKDLGRFEVTRQEEDKNKWRVPTLRNIALTAPYFHHGKVADLNEAVRVMAKTQLNKDLNDDDVNLIVEFLGSLTGDFPKMTFPRLPDYINRKMP